MSNVQNVVKINTPNRMIEVRGVVVRTPVEIVTKTKEELERLQTKINSEGITDYSIKPYVKEKPKAKKVTAKKEVKKKKDTIKKDSTLGQILDE